MQLKAKSSSGKTYQYLIEVSKGEVTLGAILEIKHEDAPEWEEINQIEKSLASQIKQLEDGDYYIKVTPK